MWSNVPPDGGSDVESQRAAANITVTLSSQIITASLAVIAVEGAFATFALDKRNTEWYLTLFVLLTFASFIGSMISAGLGIHRTRQAVFNNEWEPATGINQFIFQFWLGVLGIVFFCLSLVFSGTPKAEDVQETLRTLDRKGADQQEQIDSLSRQVKSLRQELDSSTNAQSSGQETDTNANKKR
jgi:uncharacterized protein YdaL